MRRSFVAHAFAVLGLVVAGCTSDSSSSTSTESVSVPVATEPATTVPATTVPASEPATTEPTVPATTVPATLAPATEPVAAYFLLAEQLHVVGRQVTIASPEDAVRALLAGPTTAEAAVGIVTLVPAGTELNGMVVNGNEAVVDLSAAFDTGGGSLSVTGRVAQVVFTVTQFDGIDTVRFSIDGRPVTELTGEGLLVDGVHRLDLPDLIPIVLMEAPWDGQTVAQRITVSGVSNTFEAQVNYELIGPDGVILTEGWFMATSGTGTWGTFDATLDPLPAGTTGDVLVRLFEVSPKDGEHVDITEAMVHLA